MSPSTKFNQQKVSPVISSLPCEIFGFDQIGYQRKLSLDQTFEVNLEKKTCSWLRLQKKFLLSGSRWYLNLTLGVCKKDMVLDKV